MAHLHYIIQILLICPVIWLRIARFWCLVPSPRVQFLNRTIELKQNQLPTSASCKRSCLRCVERQRLAYDNQSMCVPVAHPPAVTSSVAAACLSETAISFCDYLYHRIPASFDTFLFFSLEFFAFHESNVKLQARMTEHAYIGTEIKTVNHH